MTRAAPYDPASELVGNPVDARQHSRTPSIDASQPGQAAKEFLARWQAVAVQLEGTSIPDGVSSVQAQSPDQESELTETEQQIMVAAAQGHTSMGKIARFLERPGAVVKSNLRAIYSKLDVHSIKDAVAIWSGIPRSQLPSNAFNLTGAERRVMTAFAQGYEARATIAAVLGLSHYTVDGYVGAIHIKLEVIDLTDALMKWFGISREIHKAIVLEVKSKRDLNEGEASMLTEILGGKSYSVIAQITKTPKATVDGRAESIRYKLASHSRAEIVRYAIFCYMNSRLSVIEAALKQESVPDAAVMAQVRKFVQRIGEPLKPSNESRSTKP